MEDVRKEFINFADGLAMDSDSSAADVTRANALLGRLRSPMALESALTIEDVRLLRGYDAEYYDEPAERYGLLSVE